MNRATGFTWVVTATTPNPLAQITPVGGSYVTTRNAVGTARIYMRQARRSYRHCVQRWFL